MADTSVYERRAHPTFVHQTKVKVSILDREGLQALWTTNISKGGLFVATESPPPLGTKIHVPVTEFTDLDRSIRAQIEPYIGGGFPDRVARAEQLVVEAIELHNKDQVERARALLADAIDLDPFNQALAALAAAWKEHS